MFQTNTTSSSRGLVSIKELVVVVGLIAIMMMAYVVGYTVGQRRPDSSKLAPVQVTPLPQPSASTFIPPTPSPSTIATPSASPITGGENLNPVACTMEAKICPDGTAVGRVGPNCEFAPCP